MMKKVQKPKERGDYAVTFRLSRPGTIWAEATNKHEAVAKVEKDLRHAIKHGGKLPDGTDIEIHCLDYDQVTAVQAQPFDSESRHDW